MHNPLSSPATISPRFHLHLHVNENSIIFFVVQDKARDTERQKLYNYMRIICYRLMTFAVRKLCMMPNCNVGSQMYRRKVFMKSYSIINGGKLPWSVVTLKCTACSLQGKEYQKSKSIRKCLRNYKLPLAQPQDDHIVTNWKWAWTGQVSIPLAVCSHLK